jgi:hypothetical protein
MAGGDEEEGRLCSSPQRIHPQATQVPHDQCPEMWVPSSSCFSLSLCAVTRVQMQFFTSFVLVQTNYLMKWLKKEEHLQAILIRSNRLGNKMIDCPAARIVKKWWVCCKQRWLWATIFCNIGVINYFEFFFQVSFIFVRVCTLFCMHWWKATCILLLVMGMPKRGSSWVRSC